MNPYRRLKEQLELQLKEIQKEILRSHSACADLARRVAELQENSSSIEYGEFDSLQLMLELLEAQTKELQRLNDEQEMMAEQLAWLKDKIAAGQREARKTGNRPQFAW